MLDDSEICYSYFKGISILRPWTYMLHSISYSLISKWHWLGGLPACHGKYIMVEIQIMMKVFKICKCPLLGPSQAWHVGLESCAGPCLVLKKIFIKYPNMNYVNLNTSIINPLSFEPFSDVSLRDRWHLMRQTFFSFEHCLCHLTLMLLVANLTNSKYCKNLQNDWNPGTWILI